MGTGQVMEGLEGFCEEVSIYPVANSMPLKDLNCWVRLALQKIILVEVWKTGLGWEAEFVGREREWINASGSSYQSVIIQVIKILAGLGNIYQKRISRTSWGPTKLSNLLKATHLISSRDVFRINFLDSRPISFSIVLHFLLFD